MNTAKISLFRSMLGVAIVCAGCGGAIEPSGDGGTAATHASLQACSLINSVFAEPSMIPVGSEVSLSAIVTSPGVSYAWSAITGVFDHPEAAASHFTCTESGEVVVALAVTDADCEDRTTVVIQCE